MSIAQIGRYICRGYIAEFPANWLFSRVTLSFDSDGQRIIVRAVNPFTVAEMRRLSRRHDGDVLRGNIFLAICQASRSNAGAISVRSAANSLLIPYETARRHSLELVRRGFCQRTNGGLLTVPQHVLKAEAESPDTEAAITDLRTVIAELRRMGLDNAALAMTRFDEDFAGRPEPFSRTQLRALIDDFNLRLMENAVRSWAPLMESIALCAVMVVNTERFAGNPTIAHTFSGAATPPPAELWQPATLARATNALGWPRETVRRLLEDLVRRERLVRLNDGYTISMEFMQSPATLGTGLSVSRFTAQFLRQLAMAGFEF